ncbi:hypothetical protein DY000_02036310 [Brassica cretica]|uniref:Uncharacterized protein n=1 Tax=Brassica cretica TaxID=69181 RepID=A0ABQ7BEK0_BRACR|nr:hypothetical protein DY000_02036310 [Brassica cretica]
MTLPLSPSLKLLLPSTSHPMPSGQTRSSSEAARAFSDKDTARAQQILWTLNELSSPYGDTEQKLASYFLQAHDRFRRTMLPNHGHRCIHRVDLLLRVNAQDRAQVPRMANASRSFGHEIRRHATPAANHSSGR